MYKEGKGLAYSITGWIWKINLGHISKNLGGMTFSICSKWNECFFYHKWYIFKETEMFTLNKIFHNVHMCQNIT